MHSIVSTLSIAGEGPHASRYVVIPMERVVDNDHVLANNSIKLVPDAATAHAEDIPAYEAAARAAMGSPYMPGAPEEPQIGFRYDATEEYQPAMRYGRRSKLELLWRLGAIPFARQLDARTLPWEHVEREHVTADTWGSIPGAVGGPTTADSDVYKAHDIVALPPPASDVADPQRGPLAFCRAGWVYRLFSGDKTQEDFTPQAAGRRTLNRIKGTVAFLEHLDEDVARGTHGCPPTKPYCGFSNDKLWNFADDAVERLRQKYRARRPDAITIVDRFEELVKPRYEAAAELLYRSHATLIDFLNDVDADEAAQNATYLALAGHITGNATYTQAASDLVIRRFVQHTPLFYRHGNQRAQLQRHAHESSSLSSTDGLFEDGTIGYAFPLPPLMLRSEPSWADAGDLRRAATLTDLPPLPFDSFSFDVSFSPLSPRYIR